MGGSGGRGWAGRGLCPRAMTGKYPHFVVTKSVCRVHTSEVPLHLTPKRGPAGVDIHTYAFVFAKGAKAIAASKLDTPQFDVCASRCPQCARAAALLEKTRHGCRNERPSGVLPVQPIDRDAASALLA